jgi:hypothetical protein
MTQTTNSQTVLSLELATPVDTLDFSAPAPAPAPAKAETWKIYPEERAAILEQIGRMTLGAISGGRFRALDDGVELPVSAGYHVRVQLTPADVYTVSRIFRRGSREWVKGERTNVYCDEVSDTAYRASCFRSYDEAEW